MRNQFKQIILMLVFASFMIIQSGAQESRSNIHIGIKAGTNYANVYDSEGEEFESDAKFGAVGGVFFAIPIGKYVGLHPEVLISQKGFKASGKILGSNYKLTRTTNYLAIPLLLAIKPSEFITIVAGPQYSYLFNQKDELETSVSSSEQQKEFENDNIRKNTLGFLGGIDFNFAPLVLGTRAGWDFQENNGDGTNTTPRYKNAWLQATLGIRF